MFVRKTSFCIFFCENRYFAKSDFSPKNDFLRNVFFVFSEKTTFCEKRLFAKSDFSPKNVFLFFFLAKGDFLQKMNFMRK